MIRQPRHQQQDQRLLVLLQGDAAGRPQGRQKGEQGQLQRSEQKKQDRPKLCHVADAADDLRPGQHQPRGTHQHEQRRAIHPAIQKMLRPPRRRH